MTSPIRPLRVPPTPCAPRVMRASDHPLGIDRAIAATLSAVLRPAWQAWLQAPRVRLLERLGPLGRGVIAIAPERSAEDGCSTDLDPALTGRWLTLRVLDERGRVCELSAPDATLAQLADDLDRLDDTRLAHALANCLRQDVLQAVCSDEESPWPVLRHAIPHANAAAELLFLAPEGRFDPGVRGALLPALRQRERQLQEAAHQHLAQGLDRSLAARLHSVGVAPTLTHINWLAGTASDVQARRLHALLIAPRFCRAFLTGDVAARGAFEAAVDAGASLWSFLEAHYRLPVVGLRDADPPDRSGGHAPRNGPPLRRQG